MGIALNSKLYIGNANCHTADNTSSTFFTLELTDHHSHHSVRWYAGIFRVGKLKITSQIKFENDVTKKAN